MEIEDIYKQYESQMIKHMNNIRQEMLEEFKDLSGVYVSGPEDGSTADTAQVTMTLQYQNESLIIDFEIADSEEYDGEDNGINFIIDACNGEGDWTAGLTPYNYTADCWVNRNDANAVEERFQLAISVDTSEFVYLIGEWLKRKR